MPLPTAAVTDTAVSEIHKRFVALESPTKLSKCRGEPSPNPIPDTTIEAPEVTGRLPGAILDTTGASRDMCKVALAIIEAPVRSSAASCMSTTTASIADIESVGRLAEQTSMVPEVHEVETHSVPPRSSVVFFSGCANVIASKLIPNTVTNDMLAVVGRLEELIHVMAGGGIGAMDGGCVVGSRLGARVGAAIGLTLGDPVGCPVGKSDGCCELYCAAVVGASDGEGDGSANPEGALDAAEEGPLERERAHVARAIKIGRNWAKRAGRRAVGRGWRVRANERK